MGAVVVSTPVTEGPTIEGEVCPLPPVGKSGLKTWDSTDDTALCTPETTDDNGPPPADVCDGTSLEADAMRLTSVVVTGVLEKSGVPVCSLWLDKA